MPEYSNSWLSKFEQCALQYKFLPSMDLRAAFSEGRFRMALPAGDPAHPGSS